MNNAMFDDYVIVMEECVKSLWFESFKICKAHNQCIVKVYKNLKSNKYRSIANIYFFNIETKERIVFEVRECECEEEAVNKLLLAIKRFYEEKGDLIYPNDGTNIIIAKFLPSWKF